ncbi:peptidoglycan-binding protein [Caproiciproducens galactitolivorans]|uniref:Putative peptidoglycan binding domain protein n=1 Tax=Caproiciproducens galactitolivorans TaxID=642589 RepID=A0A4Z0YJJ1_9FIRM|nr:peptidoglycan-binding domain-containing protein [Caproiciproducens galactitolivorans]QEY34419.1 peptidoglycan-binding protein [Caproiciproducens galactitolivorans]TGJ77806.1 putative peptidoglycan binding domain protein [Caproiciproducens galactitolivorans]
MKKCHWILSAFLAATVAVASFATTPTPAAAAEAKTGVGLSEHVLKAYEEGWQYRSSGFGQFFGSSRGTDCSGLIKSYLWWTDDSSNPKPNRIAVAGSSASMLESASVKGTINYSDPSSLPRIHGLILYQPGHVGVYIGDNMAVDNRDYGVNMKCEKVFGRSRAKWTMWFKLPQITYPTNGFVTYNGEKYYYENGQYVVNATRTIKGVTYTFGESGTVTSTSNAEIRTVDQAKPVEYFPLQLQSRGSEVKKLEQRLKELGYYSSSIGAVYDDSVYNSVLLYQHAAGLKETGIADQNTLQSIYGANAVKNPAA